MMQDWNGVGGPPVAGVWVEYILRFDPDTVKQAEADELVWSHDGGGDDIIGYRVIGDV